MDDLGDPEQGQGLSFPICETRTIAGPICEEERREQVSCWKVEEDKCGVATMPSSLWPPAAIIFKRDSPQDLKQHHTAPHWGSTPFQKEKSVTTEPVLI